MRRVQDVQVAYPIGTSSRSAPATEPRTALIVQHDPSTAEAIAQLLRTRGYWTMVAGALEQATSRFRTTAPALIVMDPVLSDGDGMALVRRATASSRVLLTSAFPDGIADAAESLGLTILLKPFARDDLLALLE